MKRWAAIGLALMSATAWAADWKADFHPLMPGRFPPPRAQTAKYRFGWGAVAAAEGEVAFSRVKDQLQLLFRTRTTGPVRALWQLDAEHTARCQVATLRPVWVQQIERYRRETEKTTIEFTAEEATRLGERIPPTKTPPKKKRFKFPGAVDLQSALLLVRSQRLAPGDRYTLVVYPTRSAYLARVSVVGRETIAVAGRRYPAIKLQVSLQGIDKKLTLKPHEKFRNAFAWLSDDADRLLVKIESEVFVGSVWMELQSVEFLDGGAQRTQMPR